MIHNGVSVVVPVFNSARILPLLVERVRSVLSSASLPFEIILVDDASSDGSWDVISGLTERVEEVCGIRLMRNYGQHNALLCGIRNARYDVTVTMDDDLQHPPEEIPRLLESLSSYDVVYGTPVRLQHGFARNLASRLTKLVLQNAMGAETAEQISAFRAFRTQLRTAFENYQDPFVSIDVLLTWASARFSAVPVKHNERASGKSNYTARKLIRHAVNMTTGFSTLPLRVASVLGFGLTLLGGLLFVYVVTQYFLRGGSVPGFPFLASVIVIFSGAQMFALGIIGEYLARMHFRIMRRPAYTVRTIASSQAQHGDHEQPVLVRVS